MIVGVARLVWRAAGIGDAFHLGRHAAALELGHGEFLAAARICIYRAGTGFRDERGGARSARTLPRAIFASGVLIALIYIAGTVAVLTLY